MKHFLILLALLLLLLPLFKLPARAQPSEGEGGKTRSTIYTDEKVANARKNIQRYDWARKMRDNAVQEAEKYLGYGEERLWEMVTPQSLPRSYAVNYELGSPITGKEFNEKYGYRGWLADPLNEPWKLTDPSSGYKFPTNDFESYYKSGLDEHGIFDPKRADKRFLINELYPEKGPDWGVDDGFGWVDEEGNRWTFIAYYNHWHVWHGGVVDNAIRAFRDAYLYTGDLRYARAGIILLDRVADVYPEMDVSVYKEEDGFLNSHGGTGKGKIRGSIWEATAVPNYLSAYDAFFPVVEESGAVEFLRDKAREYKLDNPKDTADAVRKNIEDNLVRQIFPAVKNAQIRGNFGMHQRALAMAAVVLDEPGTTEAWIDWVFQTGGLYSTPDWHLTGGNVMTTLVNQVDRDGFGDEPSTEYNSYWLQQIMDVADVLQGYDRYPKADLYNNVKLRKMFDTRYPLVMVNNYTPTIGDSFKTGNPGIVGTVQEHVKAFEKYRKPVYAQLAHLLNGNTTDGLHGDIFSADPEKVVRDIERVIDEEGPFNPGSINLSGFGFAALRDGKPPSDRGITYKFSELKRIDATAEVTDFLGRIHLETDELGKRLPEAFDIPEDYYDNAGAVQLEAARKGKRISFAFRVPSTDRYRLLVFPLESTGYGRYEIRIDGKKVKEHDFYGTSPSPEPVDLGEFRLTKGTHTISFVNTGKHPEATNYKLGISKLVLKNRAALTQEAKDSRNLRGLWLYYGRNQVGRHGHKDTLNLGLHAFGLDLSPDLGYPDNFKDRTEWVSNTVSHNTVVVDRSKQKDHWVGIPHHFDASSRVQLIDVEAPKVYPQTERYRRTTAMIRVDEENSYAVDFFRVKGGKEHHFSFHGAEGEVTTEGLRLVPQPKGTYAGEDVEFGEKEPDQPDGWEYAGSGFHYLTRVERDRNPSGPFSVDWKIRDTWGVLPQEEDIHLRLTMLSPVDEVALADGYPPKLPGNPKSLRYLIARRSGEDLESQFVSVLEPYKNRRFIRSVEPATLKAGGKKVDSNTAAAVKVTLSDGRVDYIVNSLDPEVTYTVDGKFRFQGFFGVYSEKGGKPVYAYLHDGRLLGPASGPPLLRSHGHIKGTVEEFTRELTDQNRLTVKRTGPAIDPKEIIGKQIFVETDGERNGSYEIREVRPASGNRWVLDLGDITLVRRYKDENNFSKGYVYNLKKGASWRIPLSAEWFGK